nr:Flp pilus assembly protein CpaB [Modestobacter muralis]
MRRPRSPVHLLRQVAAAALAGLALVLALQPPPPVTGPVTTTVPVVVAAADLPAGAALTAGDLVVAQLPADAAPAGVVADVPQLTDAVLASPVRSGEPVTDVRVVGAGLWSAVPAGQVAAPVRLADLAVSTLLRAGDRVDVLATGDVAAGDAGGGPAVQVVASGALVLTAPAAPGGDAAVGGAPEPDGLLVLAVTPETAGRLAAAAASATLTVTLGRP